MADEYYGFNRTAAVAAVRDFYIFLTKMYLHESCIMEPPPGGWPEDITPETMCPLGKTDEVVDLLRHLPYLRSHGDDECQFLPYARCAVWPDIANSFIQGTEDRSVLICTDGFYSFNPDLDREEPEPEPEPNGGVVPPYCIGLTFARREEAILLLDTRRGKIWWPECPHEIECSDVMNISTTQEERDDANVPVILKDDKLVSGIETLQFSDEEDTESCTSSGESPPTSDDEDQEEAEEDGHDDGEDEDEEDDDDSPEWVQENWCPAWAIQEFFEKMKRYFRQLDFVPESAREVREGWSRHDKDQDVLKMIYRKYGWPDLQVFQKEACRAEIRAVLYKRDPEHYNEWYWDSRN